MSAAQKTAPREVTERPDDARRQKAVEAARTMRGRIEAGDYEAAARDAQERFPRALDLLAK